MTATPSAAIIILNWNNWPDTLACVASCHRLTWPGARIIVVDNGSTDGSEELLRKRFPEAEIIQTGSNLGFAGGNNAGIRHALSQGAEYVWLLNNDAVAEPDSLTKLIEAMEQYGDAAIAGSKIFYDDNPERIWFAGGIWERNRLRIRQRGAGEYDHGQYEQLCTVGSVSGCSMIVRSSAIEKIGLMNETYFLYWEDTDWCARAWEQGFKVLFVPASRIRHKVAATIAPRSERQYYYNTRNGLFFCRRHSPRLLPVFLAYAAADVLAGMLRGNISMLRGFMRGIADFFRGHSGR